VVDELGSRKHIEKVHQIFETGTGADRQLRVFNETGSLIEVVKYIERSFLEV
jgi:carboxylate-amine ligase